MTVKDADDLEFLELARHSGCCHINIGIESVQEDSLRQMHKLQNRAYEYGHMIALLNRVGIPYSLNFVFGWDTDTIDTFRETLHFLNCNQVPAAFFVMLVPAPGTAIYKQLADEGRLLHDEPFAGRNARCVFQPEQMTPDQLERGVRHLRQDFYSLGSMFRRGIFRFSGGADPVLANFVFAVSSRLGIDPLDFF